MICGELMAPHVRPRGYAPALTDLKKNDCISGVIESSADADDLAPILTAFVDSGKCSATWFLPPSKNVFTIKPSLQLSSKLLAQDPMEALPTSDDWSYVVDGFAPKDFFQVPSATYLSPLSKKLKTKCVESKVHGDGPKCSKSPAKSYFHDAPAKIDVSQLFTYIGSKTWSIA